MTGTYPTNPFEPYYGTPAQVRTHSGIADQVLEEQHGEMLKARDKRVREQAIKDYKNKLGPRE